MLAYLEGLAGGVDLEKLGRSSHCRISETQ